MGAEILDTSGGVVTIRISGRLLESELSILQGRAAEILRALGKARILVLADAFEGWEQGGEWGDFTLLEQNDPHIERMAIVGDRQWEDQVLLFVAKGLRPFPIEYFALDDLARARAWLETPP